MSECASFSWFKMPPRVNAAEYLAFVTELMLHVDPIKAARQKAVEERITVPFSLVREDADTEESHSACSVSV